MTDITPLLREPAFWRRGGITLGALGIYCLGLWIPIPGIDLSSIPPSFGSPSLSSAIERLSVLALGMTPILSALILLELLLMAWPWLRKWASASADNEGSLNGWIILLALAIAGFQANGVAVAMENFGSLVPSPGLAFRAGVIVTLVAGTAFLCWLASLVTRHGLGSGFFLFLAAPLLLALPSLFASQILAWDEAASFVIPLTLAAFFAAAAALVMAGRLTPPLAGTGQILWPVLLAYTIAPWLLLLLLGVSVEAFSNTIELLKPGQPLRLLILPALTLVFYFLRALSLAQARPTSDDGFRWEPALLVVFAVAVSELLLFSLPAPLALNGQNIAILVAFALAIVDGLGLRHSSTGATDSQSHTRDTI